MPGRKVVFVNDCYYHIFNRGVEKRDIFTQLKDYKRFTKALNYYRLCGPKPSFSKFNQFSLHKPSVANKLVSVLCYCFMPNHFHFLVRQLKENGVSTFISQLSNSYTKYFNTKYRRVGALFQGVFSAVMIESGEQLIHTSRYIHLNPAVSGIVNRLEDYPWSSYHEYMNGPFICDTSEILNFLHSKEKYKKFIEDQIDYGTTLEILKHQLVEEV